MPWLQPANCAVVPQGIHRTDEGANDWLGRPIIFAERLKLAQLQLDSAGRRQSPTNRNFSTCFPYFLSTVVVAGLLHGFSQSVGWPCCSVWYDRQLYNNQMFLIPTDQPITSETNSNRQSVTSQLGNREQHDGNQSLSLPFMCDKCEKTLFPWDSK